MPGLSHRAQQCPQRGGDGGRSSGNGTTALSCPYSPLVPGPVRSDTGPEEQSLHCKVTICQNWAWEYRASFLFFFKKILNIFPLITVQECSRMPQTNWSTQRLYCLYMYENIQIWGIEFSINFNDLKQSVSWSNQFIQFWPDTHLIPD